MTMQSPTATRPARIHFGDQLQEIKWAHTSSYMNPSADCYYSETVRIFHTRDEDDVLQTTTSMWFKRTAPIS